MGNEIQTIKSNSTSLATVATGVTLAGRDTTLDGIYIEQAAIIEDEVINALHEDMQNQLIRYYHPSQSAIQAQLN